MISTTPHTNSPGLSTGWTDNYDQVISSSNTSSWVPLTLQYANNSTETITPPGTVVAGAQLLSRPNGDPYAVYGTPITSGGVPVTGEWAYIVIETKDRTKLVFTPDTGGYTTFHLTQIVNVAGHAVNIARDYSNSARITAITNDAVSPLTLLSFTYSGIYLSTITDEGAGSSFTGLWRKVDYAFTSGLLSDVSQPISTSASMTTANKMWNYTYTPVRGYNELSAVKSQDPTNVGNLSANGGVVNYGSSSSTVFAVGATDENGGIRTYQFNNNSGSHSVGLNVYNITGSHGLTFSTTSNYNSSTLTNAGFTDVLNDTDTTLYGGPNAYLASQNTNRNGQISSVFYKSDGYGNVDYTLSPRGVQTQYGYQYPSDFPLGQVNSVQVSNSSALSPITLQATNLTYYTTTGSGAINGMIDIVSTPKPGTTNGAPATVATTFAYDPTLVNGNPLGNISTVTSPAPASTGTVTTTYNYTTDGSYSVPTPAIGEPLTETDPNFEVTHFRYDARGNRITITDASGYETDYYYNIANQVQAIAYPYTTATAANRAVLYTTYQYPGGPVANVALYSEGQLTIPTPGSTFPAPSGVSPFRKSTYTYGVGGQLTDVADLIGLLKHYDYDGLYRLIDETDGAGNTTLYRYTSNGSLLSVQYPLNSGSNSPGTPDSLVYGYDKAQNVLYTVDGRGVVTADVRNDSESLVTQTLYGGLPVTVSGNGTSITVGSLPSGVASIGNITNAYDSLGRLTSWSDGTGSLTYGDPAAPTTPGYDDLGNVLLTTRSFTGGPQGQQLAYSYFLDGRTGTIALPTSSQVTNALTLNGNEFSYMYDGVSRLHYITTPWQNPVESYSTPDKVEYSYYPNSWLKDYYGAWVQSAYFNNSRGFETELENTAYNAYGCSGDISGSFSMAYDADGNRTSVSLENEDSNNLLSWGRSINYIYDGRSRLTQENSSASSLASPGTGGVLTYTSDLTYDGADNIQGFKDTSQPYTGDLGFNADNQLKSLSGTTAFAYDAAGNMTLGPTSSFTPLGGLFAGNTVGYDPEERLVSVKSGSTTLLTNTYDADGVRATKLASGDTAGTTYYLYDVNTGAPLIEETYAGGSASISAVNLYGADGWRERYIASGSSHELVAYAFDAQGNVVNRLNSGDYGYLIGEPATDAVVWDAWGESRNDNYSGISGDSQYTPTNDPAGFEAQYGYQSEWESALARTWGTGGSSYEYFRYTPYLLTHRYYDPSTGRFVNRDPIGYKGGQNLYGYARDNPVNRIDPSGFYDFKIGDKSHPILEFSNSSVSQGWQISTASIANAFSSGRQGKTSSGVSGSDSSLAAATLSRDALMAAFGIQATGKMGGASNPLTNWWNKASSTKLSAIDSVYYEIGQKTLRNAKYANYQQIADPVAKGRALVSDEGWLSALFKYEGTGFMRLRGKGATLETGPTPAARVGLRTLGAIGFLAGDYFINRDIYNAAGADISSMFH